MPASCHPSRPGFVQNPSHRQKPCSMKPLQFTVYVQEHSKGSLHIFLVLVLLFFASPHFLKGPFVAASPATRGGGRADVSLPALSDGVGAKTFHERCFHDPVSAQYQKFRLREIPRSSSQSSSTCTFSKAKHREERVENPRCRSNPALELVAHGCHIEKFDPHVMLRLLHNRTLFLVGDSVTLQWKDSLQCVLAPYMNKVGPWLNNHGGPAKVRSDRNTTSDSDRRGSGAFWSSYSPDYQRIQEVPDELESCAYSTKNCTEYSDGVHTTTLCMMGQVFALYPLEKENAACWKQMKETDIAVVNFGMHANAPEHVWAGLQNFVSFVKNSRSSGSEAKLPNLIWRESSPQHFQTPGGSYPYGNPEAVHSIRMMPCKDISLKNATLNEVRNRIMLPAIRRAGIPVLPVWQLTATDSKHHPGNYLKLGSDCTHFCLYSGSVHDSWSAMLQNLLVGLTTHCDGREPFQECLLAMDHDEV